MSVTKNAVFLFLLVQFVAISADFVRHVKPSTLQSCFMASMSTEQRDYIIEHVKEATGSTDVEIEEQVKHIREHLSEVLPEEEDRNDMIAWCPYNLIYGSVLFATVNKLWEDLNEDVGKELALPIEKNVNKTEGQKHLSVFLATKLGLPYYEDLYKVYEGTHSEILLRKQAAIRFRNEIMTDMLTIKPYKQICEQRTNIFVECHFEY